MMLKDSMRGLKQGCSERTVRLNYHKLLRQGASEFEAGKIVEKMAINLRGFCSPARQREIMTGKALKL